MVCYVAFISAKLYDITMHNVVIEKCYVWVKVLLKWSDFHIINQQNLCLISSHGIIGHKTTYSY